MKVSSYEKYRMRNLQKDAISSERRERDVGCLIGQPLWWNYSKMTRIRWKRRSLWKWIIWLYVSLLFYVLKVCKGYPLGELNYQYRDGWPLDVETKILINGFRIFDDWKCKIPSSSASEILYNSSRGKRFGARKRYPLVDRGLGVWYW